MTSLFHRMTVAAAAWVFIFGLCQLLAVAIAAPAITKRSAEQYTNVPTGCRCIKPSSDPLICATKVCDHIPPRA